MSLLNADMNAVLGATLIIGMTYLALNLGADLLYPPAGSARAMEAPHGLRPWRGWLLTETPSSRRQAAWGQRYRMWLAFSSNPVAMLGLVLTVLLFLCAAAARAGDARSGSTGPGQPAGQAHGGALVRHG
ncbi:MAG: hypothetical protein U1E70_15405 [Acetobacteraceae bacterium]